MNDSAVLWDSYRTTEQRVGPLPVASTPRTPRSIRGPETPNVTNIVVGDSEQDENIDLQGNCGNCKNLQAEVQLLREKVEKQSQFIKSLLKSMNSTSEMDSSESQVGNGSSVSTAKSSTKIQRVTPTKREATGSSSSTSSTSSPVVRHILQQLPSQRSPRTPTQQNMARNVSVRPLSNRSSSTASSQNSQILQTPPTRRTRLPPILRTPQSLPMGTTTRNPTSDTTPVVMRPHAASARRSQSRRRLFASEPLQLEERQHTTIEHLNISPVKDDQWGHACPPRLHLERNRPEFIERLEARQRIIRAASEKRSEIEHRKRIAARAVATGERSVESVSRDLFADSTAVRAFYEKDMKEQTMKNIRRSQSYQNKIWQRMANMDRVANRIIAQTHSLRARSTSRNRGNF